MTLVAIESPFAGNVEVNLAYARDALRDTIARGEAAIASHLLYPQVLEDGSKGEREFGIAAGLAWSEHADVVAFYTDNGWSDGMFRAWVHASLRGKTIEMRSLYCVVCRNVRDASPEHAPESPHLFTPGDAGVAPSPYQWRSRAPGS